MADFKIGSVNSRVFQGADSIVNHGVIGSDPSEASIDDLLRELRTEVHQATGAQALPATTVAEIEAATGAVEIEAGAEQPNPRRAITALNHLKGVAAGLASAAGIAEAADRIVQIFSDVA